MEFDLLLFYIMKKSTQIYPLLVALLISVFPVLVASQDSGPEPGDEIMGTWLSGAEGGELAKVLIFRNAEPDNGIDGVKSKKKNGGKNIGWSVGSYFGKIVWLEYPEFKDDDEQGMAGMTKVDRDNPDPKLRNLPILQLVILKGFRFEPDRKWPWTGGTVYDPENGKTYRCRMRIEKDGRLKIRGYVGIPLFGRSTWWTRTQRTIGCGDTRTR